MRMRPREVVEQAGAGYLASRFEKELVVQWALEFWFGAGQRNAGCFGAVTLGRGFNAASVGARSGCETILRSSAAMVNKEKLVWD